MLLELDQAERDLKGVVHSRHRSDRSDTEPRPESVLADDAELIQEDDRISGKACVLTGREDHLGRVELPRIEHR